MKTLVNLWPEEYEKKHLEGDYVVGPKKIFTYKKPGASVTIISIIILFKVIFRRVLSRGLDTFEG